jgi:outer membrane protein TolC
MAWILPCFLLLSAAAASPADSKTLSFSEAVRLALEVSPRIDAARRREILGDLEHRNARARRWPSLDVSTTNGFTSRLVGPPASEQDPYYSTLNLGLTEILYDNGLASIQVAQTELEKRLARLLVDREADRIALDVAQGFFSYSLAQKLREVRQKQLSLVEKQSESVSRGYREGLKTKRDFVRFQGQLHRTQADLVSSEAELERSREELRRLIGISPDKSQELDFVPYTLSPGSSLSIPADSPSLQRTHDYLISEVRKDINSKAVEVVERRYWPQLFLTGGIQYQNTGYLGSRSGFGPSGQVEWSALVTLSHNLWDWGIRRRELEGARQEYEIRNDDLSLTVQATSAQIRSLMATLSRAAEAYSLSEKLLKLERESFESIDVGYREGKVTYLDLITALNLLLDAQTRLYTSFYSLQRLLAEHKYLERSLSRSILSQ